VAPFRPQTMQEEVQAEHRVMLDAFLRGDDQRLAEATEQHRERLLAAALRGTSEAPRSQSIRYLRPYPLDRPGAHSRP
jgi:DNA-binding GntR family transcriptional regulator